MVQTVKNSYDGASVRSSRIAPPPAKPQETKTPCSTWLLGLLGLLGLIGLILAIVLSQNSKNSTTVQSNSPTVSDPLKVNSAAPAPTASKIVPTQDVSNAEVKGQTVVTNPTVVAASINNTQAIATVTAPKPTDISVARTATVNTQTTVLTGVQPHSISPTYVNTPQPATSTTTATTTTTTSNTQPMTVQPVMTPGTQVATNSSNSANTQPITVQPTAITQPTTTQQSTVQTKNADWILASTTPTSIPATTTSSNTASTTSNQLQTAGNNQVAPTTSTNTTTITTVTTTTKPSHFLGLRHHL
jgi:hypothetical protein